MKAFVFTLLFILVGVTALAQDQKFKVGVFATASEIKQLFPSGSDLTSVTDVTDYKPNLSAELMATVAKSGNLRFSSGVNYRRNFDTDTDTYYLAGQISYHASVFEPFGRFSAGVDRTKIPNNLTRTTFSREILVGADINFKHFYFRPVGVGFRRTGELFSPAERTFQSGVGFIF